MKTSYIAGGLLAIGLGFTSTAYAQTIERGVHTIFVDNSTSPAAETYEGKDRNREVRYTNTQTNTDLGAREYRETAHDDNIGCGRFGCFGTMSRSEDTGTVVNAQHGALVNINAGETEHTSKTLTRFFSDGVEDDTATTSRFANGSVANDAVGLNAERRSETYSFDVGPVNEDGTGVEGYDESPEVASDLTSLDAHVLSNEVAVQHITDGAAGHGVNLQALDAVEIGFDTVSGSPTVAFGPRMPLGGFLNPLFEDDFATNAIANNGFAQGILGNGFVQNGLAVASPVTDLLPVGVPGQ